MADFWGAMVGAAFGTSPTVSFIESAAGIQQGSRTGPTALTIAAPPQRATAGVCRCMMAQSLKPVDWGDQTEYFPAMLIVLAMPFTFSVATGIGLGFLARVGVKTMARRRTREVHGAVLVRAVPCAVTFAVG